jgi:hypothetical protein
MKKSQKESKEIKTGLAKDHISFSQISDYIECPGYYYRRYHEKLNKATLPMALGSMRHEIARRINEIILKNKEELSPEDVQAIVKEESTKLQGFTLSLETYNHTQEKMMLFAEQAFANSKYVIACEHPVRISIDDMELEGRIDELSMDAVEPGVYYITDYKSSPLVPTEDQVRYNPQYNIYALSVYRDFKDNGIKKIYAVQQSLETGIRIKAEIDLGRMENTEHWLLIMWEQMKNEKTWACNPDSMKCFYCPKRCQEYLDMCRSEFNGIDITQDPEAVFDNYLSLKTRVDAMEKQMETFKEAVKATLALAPERTVDHKGIKYRLIDKKRVNPVRLVETTSTWNEVSVVKDIIKKAGKK